MRLVDGLIVHLSPQQSSSSRDIILLSIRYGSDGVGWRGNAVYDGRFRFTCDFEKCAHDMSTTNRIGLS